MLQSTRYSIRLPAKYRFTVYQYRAGYNKMLSPRCYRESWFPHHFPTVPATWTVKKIGLSSVINRTWLLNLCFINRGFAHCLWVTMSSVTCDALSCWICVHGSFRVLWVTLLLCVGVSRHYRLACCCWLWFQFAVGRIFFNFFNYFTFDVSNMLVLCLFLSCDIPCFMLLLFF